MKDSKFPNKIYKISISEDQIAGSVFIYLFIYNLFTFLLEVSFAIGSIRYKSRTCFIIRKEIYLLNKHISFLTFGFSIAKIIKIDLLRFYRQMKMQDNFNNFNNTI